MKYATLISIVFHLCSCFYIFIGAYVHLSNLENRIGRLYLMLATSMSSWAFGYAVANSAPTAEASAYWRSFGVLGLGVFYSILLHFLLIFTNDAKLLNKRYGALILIPIYLPAVINVILFSPFGPLADTQYTMVQGDFGWVNIIPPNWGGIWIKLYSTVYSIAAIVLFLFRLRKIKGQDLVKRQISFVLASGLIPAVAVVVTDMIPGVLDANFFFKTAIVFNILPMLLLFDTLKKFGLLSEKSDLQLATSIADKDINKDRMGVFRMAGVTFSAGAAISFLIGYYLQNGPIEREFLLSLALFVIGILSTAIARITADHKVQNTVFLALCTAGMIFFMMTNLKTGALTAWAVFIIFLMFTVVLESRIHATVFTLICVLIQIVFWILRPKIPAIIDGGEYLARIFIIIFSCFAVTYLTIKYASKAEEHKRFAQEQEALEKISSNYIMVSSENIRMKADEMFEMSAEILAFDRAYLLKFDEKYEEVTVLNTYSKDDEAESVLYRPGMLIKVAELPPVRHIVGHKSPMVVENVGKLPIDREEEINFFRRRGINSFFALPILLETELIGVLVVEYYIGSSVRAKENRLHFLGILTNILADARKKTLYEEQLYDVAYFDEATKLANRHMLKKIMEQILDDKSESDRVVVFNIELDNLRTINDTFGHSVVDWIILKSAAILEDVMEEECTLARISEEKFIIVMPTSKDIDHIKLCANKILDAFSDPILSGEGIEALFVAVSIGVAVSPEDGSDAETLLKNSDLAGYEAKTADSRVVFCSDQMRKRNEENTLLTNKLFNALQNEEFSLEFQPQISSDTGKIAGVEALLRWTTSENRRVPPDTFIPILEQTGLIHEVGLWVLEQALKEHNRLVEKGFPPLRFSINLSVVQFRRDDFVPELSGLVKESRIDPKYIELEITETMLSQNFADTIEKLDQLKALGVSIAIDDFGKGYSSLHRLELVPFDRLKIDKSIVDDITIKKKKIVIAKVIVSLAKSLMAEITAEGVETKEQLDFLRDIACDEIQGYYFSKPLTPEALEDFLKQNYAETGRERP